MSSAAIRLTAIGAVGNTPNAARLRGRTGAAAVRRGAQPAATDTGSGITRYQWRGAQPAATDAGSGITRYQWRGAQPAATDTGGGITRYQWRGSAMGLPVWLAVAAPDPAALDAARARLTELVGRWAQAGPHSEVARLNTYRGVMMSVSLDTVLLAQLLVRGPQRRGVWVDGRHGRVGFASDHPLDVTGPAAALASDLIISDAWEAGAFGVSVRLGATARTVVGAVGGVSGDRQALRDIAVVTLSREDLAGLSGSGRPGSGWSGSGLSGSGRSGSGWSGSGWLAAGASAAGSSIAGPLAAGPWPVDGPRSVTVVADRAWRAYALAGRLLGVPASRAGALLAGAGLAARLVRPDGATLDVGDFAAAARAATAGDGAEPDLVEICAPGSAPTCA
jgi:hypothetical protein